MYGTIQVDVDGIWTILKGSSVGDYDPVFEVALPRFLRMFDRYKIKATFFVTGNDLKVKEKIRFVHELVENGHEIANHSMTHNVDFMLLKKERKEKEIKETEKLMSDLFGSIPVGFRAPAYSIDKETLGILEGRGYLYDSSLLPSFAGPLINLMDNVFSGGDAKTKFGKAVNYFAPLRPYRPDHENIVFRGDMSIVEVPVTTCPFFRVPFHSSFLFASSPKLFDICYNWVKASKLPINYVLHGVDLIDPLGGKVKSKQPSLGLKYSCKEKTYKHILSSISRDYKLLTTKDHVKRIL